MPELPEVETIVLDLNAHLPGRRIVRAHVHRALPIAHPDPRAFCRQAAGQQFLHLERRGKYLLFHFASKARLVVHLRMTGSWQYRPLRDPLDRHTHVIFELDNGYELRFRDPRCFGRLYLLSDGDRFAVNGLQQLGPEPLASGFNVAYLARALARRSIAIKQALLDQRIAAGVGNIYADEALFLARLHPATSARSLQRPQLQALVKALRQALREAIAHRGTTFRDYVDSAGLVGQHQEHLRVYDRTGEPCRNCGGAIERLRLGGRSAHFCPACQAPR